MDAREHATAQPPRIMPRGLLLAVAPADDLTVLHASTNTRVGLGQSAEQVIGRPLREVLGPAAAREVMMRLEHWTSPSERMHFETTAITAHGSRPFHVSLHRPPGAEFHQLIVELEPVATGPRVPYARIQAALRGMNVMLAASQTSADACRVIAAQVRAVAQADQVSVLRIELDGTGTVVASDQRAGIESFTGERLPAAHAAVFVDAASKANPVHLIDDIRREPVEVVPGTGLDLRAADLAWAQDDEIEYMEHMGVSGVFVIHLEGLHGTWGAVLARTYRTSLRPPYPVRMAAYEAAAAMTRRLAELLAQEDAVAFRHTERVVAAVERAVFAHAGVPGAELYEIPEFVHLVDADGVFSLAEGNVHSPGPIPVNLLAMTEYMRDQPYGVIQHTSLRDEAPELAALMPQVAGVLMLHQPLGFTAWWRSAANVPALPGTGHAPNDSHRARREWRAATAHLSTPWSSADVRAVAMVDQAIDRAISDRTQHLITSSERLQRSLLPDRLPQPAGWAVDAAYLPSSGGPIGGDWYDSSILPDGRLMVLVGDVVGHGLSAAIAMAQLSGMLRGFLVEGKTPDIALATLDRVVDWTMPDVLATVMVIVVDVLTGECHAASAGHLPPLVIGPDGSADFLDVPPGPPVGAAGTQPAATRFRIEQGAALVGYTDGLVESRTVTLEAGMAALVGAWGALGADDPSPAASLVAAVELADGNDDVCALVLRRARGSV